MHPVISNLVNTSFYQTYNINTKIKADNRKHNLDFNEVVLWLDTSMHFGNKEEKYNDSYRNNLEVRVIKKRLKELIKSMPIKILMLVLLLFLDTMLKSNY